MHFSRRETCLGGLALTSAPAIGQSKSSPLSISIDVPVDHDRPAAGTFRLSCEWGAAPVPNKPTIVLVADAQQYFLRPGGAARLQESLFGRDANILGIVGRSRSDALARLVMRPGGVDWALAYRLLNWTQWARDLERVIDMLRLEAHGLGLYGRSGGAHLIHQMLTLRPATNARALVQAAVNHELDVRWGVRADHFWEQFSGSEPATARQLADWLVQHSAQRRDLVLILQRQNFFETLDELPAARLRAVRAFLGADDRAIADMRKRYQVDALDQSRATFEGVGSTVRVYEFAAPYSYPRMSSEPLSPDVEALFYYSEPLPRLRPSVHFADWERLRAQSSDVLQVAGRRDHTCDYRTQIGLNGLTRRSRLLVLDDNHVFQRWAATGREPAFLQSWFAGGWESAGFQTELAAIADLRWHE